jgi:hypothetical protein
MFDDRRDRRQQSPLSEAADARATGAPRRPGARLGVRLRAPLLLPRVVPVEFDNDVRIVKVLPCAFGIAGIKVA